MVENLASQTVLDLALHEEVHWAELTVANSVLCSAWSWAGLMAAEKVEWKVSTMVQSVGALSWVEKMVDEKGSWLAASMAEGVVAMTVVTKVDQWDLMLGNVKVSPPAAWMAEKMVEMTVVE